MKTFCCFSRRRGCADSLPRTTVDLRLDYAYSRWIVPFVQVCNLFNAPIENTQNGYFLNQQNYFDTKLEFVLRGTW